MTIPHRLLALALLLAPAPAAAQQPAQRPATDSTRPDTATPPWRTQVRYGGGPSVGAPPSDFKGTEPPAQWCLRTDGPSHGDLRGRSWRATSRYWLREVLSDTSSDNAWPRVLGGAPIITPKDSVVEVVDEPLCRSVAAIVNCDLLGWRVGPPPVIVLRVRDYLIVFPSNARIGEWGFAVGMGSKGDAIRGVAAW